MVRDGLGEAREPGWVLMVAADPIQRMGVFRLLEWAGHRATIVDTGRQALEMLAMEPFDSVLLDADMPKEVGHEILHQIKGDPKLHGLPVLVLASETAESGPWIEMGADDVLTEPFVPVVLRARINACVERKRLREREIERVRERARTARGEGRQHR